MTIFANGKRSRTPFMVWNDREGLALSTISGDISITRHSGAAGERIVIEIKPRDVPPAERVRITLPLEDFGACVTGRHVPCLIDGPE